MQKFFRSVLLDQVKHCTLSGLQDKLLGISCLAVFLRRKQARDIVLSSFIASVSSWNKQTSPKEIVAVFKTSRMIRFESFRIAILESCRYASPPGALGVTGVHQDRAGWC